jgi:predicted ATP-dependent serine protease
MSSSGAFKTLQRCPTGVPGLDAILDGGLPAGRLYLIQGDPGVGKTTMAMQFLMEGGPLCLAFGNQRGDRCRCSISRLELG